MLMVSGVIRCRNDIHRMYLQVGDLGGWSPYGVAMCKLVCRVSHKSPCEPGDWGVCKAISPHNPNPI